MRAAFRAWLGVTAFVCVAGVVAITLLRGPIAATLLASRYREAARYLPFIAAGNAMFALSIVFEKVAHATSRTGLVLAGRVIGAATSLAVGIPLIFLYHTDGAAMAVPIYYGVQLAFTGITARMLLGELK